MANAMTQNKHHLWVQPDGKSTALDMLSYERYSAGDMTVPFAGRELVPGRNIYGDPVIRKVRKTPVGSLVTRSFDWEAIDRPEFFDKIARLGQDFGVWEFFTPCGRLNNLSNATWLDYVGGSGITSMTRGASSSRDGSANETTKSVDTSAT
jgi:hypothetical protein